MSDTGSDTDESRLVRLLAARGTIRDLKPREVLTLQHEEGDDVFIVITGELQASVSLIAGGVMSRETSRELQVGSHKPGSLVGELTVIGGGVRATTLQAGNEGASVSVVSSLAFGEFVEEHPEAGAVLAARARSRMNAMRAVSLLAAVLGGTHAYMAPDFVEKADFQDLRAGQTLFAAGDESDGLYLVIAGRLTATTSRADDQLEVLGEVGPGQLVGELGLLNGLPRSATVTAARTSTVAFIPEQAFNSLASVEPGLALSFARYALTRSERQDLERRRAMIAMLPSNAEISEHFGRALAAELARLGSSDHLTADRVDSILDRSGAAQAAPGTGLHVRVTELLSEVGNRLDYGFAVADSGPSNWSSEVLEHADLVLLATTPNPDEAVVERLRSLRGSIPKSARVALVVCHRPGTRQPSSTARLQEALGVTEVHHVRGTSSPDVARLARLATGRGTGLVLGGGGARGFAHLGVIRALEENGVEVDKVTGASIGAVIGAAFCQGLEPSELIAVAERQFAKLLDYTLPVVSLLKGKRIAENINAQFSTWQIEDLWTPFSCVTTNLTRSRVEVHRQGDLASAVRASVAIPGVLPPVPSNDDLLVDGGLLNNLPVDVMTTDPSIETVIAVEVAPPQGPRAESDFGLSVSGWDALRNRVAGRREYPGLAAILVRSMLVGGARDRDLRVDEGQIDLLMDLDLRGVALLDFDRVREVADSGFRAAEPRIQAWLESVP